MNGENKISVESIILYQFWKWLYCMLGMCLWLQVYHFSWCMV